MLNRSRYKISKLYFPGLISLLGLPLLCTAFFLIDGKFKKYSQISVIWADTTFIKHLPKINSKAFSFDKFRNFDNDILTGEKTHDILVVTNCEKWLKRLDAKVDTTNGYSVTFSKKSKYEDIIKIIGVCYEPSKDVNCMLYYDKIYLYRLPQSKEVRSPLPGDVIYYSQAKDEYFNSSLQDLIDAIVSDTRSLTRFWPSLIILVIMIALSIHKRKTSTA